MTPGLSWLGRSRISLRKIRVGKKKKKKKRKEIKCYCEISKEMEKMMPDSSNLLVIGKTRGLLICAKAQFLGS